MKSRDFQRAVKAHKFDRSAGDAPSMGRVTRMPRVSSKRTRRRKKNEDFKHGRGKGGRSRRERRRVVLVWSSVFAVVSLATLATFIWIWVKKSKDQAAAVGFDGAPAQAERRVVSRYESPSEDEALDLVKRAMLIRDEAAVPRYFRMGSATAPEIVGFLRTMHQTDGEVVRYDWLSSMDANGLLIDGVIVQTAGKDAARNRLALLTPDDLGRWQIDFEAFARIVRPSWNEILEKGASRGVVRVIVAPDNYYNGPFLDDEVWVCFGMATPDSDVILSGYCRRGSPQASAMRRILENGDEPDVMGSMKRATVEIRRVEGASPRQFEISRVLAEDWVMGSRPFDEGSK